MPRNFVEMYQQFWKDLLPPALGHTNLAQEATHVQYVQYEAPCSQKQYVAPTRWYPSPTPHDVTFRKTIILNDFTALIIT